MSRKCIYRKVLDVFVLPVNAASMNNFEFLSISFFFFFLYLNLVLFKFRGNLFPTTLIIYIFYIRYEQPNSHFDRRRTSLRYQAEKSNPIVCLDAKMFVFYTPSRERKGTDVIDFSWQGDDPLSLLKYRKVY